MIAYETLAITTADDPRKIWKRYVDDVFAVFKQTSLDTFHKHINSLHQQIQFKIEHESDGKLAFLDTLVKKHENGKLSVLVYRKPTHTDQYLNCKSHHQSSCKDSVISSLVNRTMDVISENNDQQTELTYVTNALLANGYPKQQIEKVKRNISRKVILTPTEEITIEDPKAYVNLPYINGTSNIFMKNF